MLHVHLMMCTTPLFEQWSVILLKQMVQRGNSYCGVKTIVDMITKQKLLILNRSVTNKY